MSKKKESPSMTVKDCKFAAVLFDADATKIMQTMADGVVENAKVLQAMARLFDIQNVKVGTMLHLSPGEYQVNKGGFPGI